jgi:TetR/AcrR family transcriptional regulator, transcriptional repressor for nem operon
MAATQSLTLKRETVKTRLLDAAVAVIRTKGYSATTIDDLCSAAGVTKGAFFHHFASKEALGVAAANHWSETTSALFAAAPYHANADPLARIFGYIDFRTKLIDGPIAVFTCLVGTMVQEVYDSSDNIRAACEASITGHAATLEADIHAIITDRGINGVSAKSLALHTQAVLQGGFILAKASGNAELARQSAEHLKDYFELLFKKGDAQ